MRRSRDHITQILRLDEEENNKARDGIINNILKDVKRVVESSVRSLEGIYKYNDVSNRNFGGNSSFQR